VIEDVKEIVERIVTDKTADGISEMPHESRQEVLKRVYSGDVM